MTPTATETTTTSAVAGRRWPARVGYAAAAWAAAYAVLALVWTGTGSGFPFGEGDPDAIGPLRNLPAEVGAPAAAALLLATAVISLYLAGGARTGRGSRLLAGLGWLVAATLLVVVPEVKVLALVGYAPMLLLGAPFGWPDGVDYSAVFTWPLLNQVCAIIGGFLVAGTVLAWQRRVRGACAGCGRGGAPARWTQALATGGWGRWAAYVAAAVPLLYGVTRISWVFGIPLTITEEMVDDLHDSGGVWAGLGLGLFAVTGAVLTLGLVQRWEERFPRWLPGLAGRRVPVALAVVPASLVSVLVASASLGSLGSLGAFERFDGADWVFLPMAFWPLWSVALAAATLGYYLRRRGRCAHCGRG